MRKQTCERFYFLVFYLMVGKSVNMEIGFQLWWLVEVSILVKICPFCERKFDTWRPIEDRWRKFFVEGEVFTQFFALEGQ